MTTNRRADTAGRPVKERRQHDGAAAAERDQDDAGIDDLPVTADAVEAILRQLVALRATSAVDNQLAQLIRIVDSATWSTPVPMTILVDGTLLRGVLVPSEVSATFLDDALRRSAHAAVDELEHDNTEAPPDSEGRNSGTETDGLVLQQARAFLRRLKRRPFSTSQARVRQRNASALMALNDWHRTRDQDVRLTPLDVPGNYTDPGSVARDVVPYTAGQRALTLADVKMMVAGEWLALPTPVRVVVGRIGAWTVDL
jgi:hypothetical protein